MKNITIQYQDHVKKALHAANYGSRAALDQLIRDAGGMIRAAVTFKGTQGSHLFEWVDPAYPVKNSVLDLPAGEWSRNERYTSDVANSAMAGNAAKGVHAENAQA